MKNINIFVSLALAVLTSVFGFLGGIKYQQSKTQENVERFAMQRNGDRNFRSVGQNAQGQNFRPINGEVISSDEKSITVKLPDDSSKIVLVSDTTKINKASEVSMNDLIVGSKVAIFGLENSDGSLTAQSVQLDPVYNTNTNGR